MTQIRIVCAIGETETAETLRRLLTAEQHDVRISKGRHSGADLKRARTQQEAVVLIWCQGARTGQFMLDWRETIPAERLIEIARTTKAPRSAKGAAMIDFTDWRGERGGAAWTALTERLREVSARWEPPPPVVITKPPPIRAIALTAMLSACAATAVFFMLNRQAPAPTPVAEAVVEDVIEFEPLPAGIGMGGAVDAAEPPSAEELSPRPQPVERAEPEAEPTLLERLLAFNPIGDDDRPRDED